jgi:hypothetical protein
MPKFILLFLLLSSLFLAASTCGNGHVQAQAQNKYSLGIQGATWDQSRLKILLVVPNNESWWRASDLDATLRAVGQWNDAISYFASNYSDYAYLSNLNFVPTVSNETQPGFNVYLNWTEFPVISTSNELGLESTSSLGGVVINATINLTTHTSHGDAVTDGDMQNVALHELGHSLGLEHCNYSGDVMYPAYTLLSSAESLSTLDVYGVATVFSFSSIFNQSGSIGDLSQIGSVVLPPNIQYSYLPVSAQNARPQTVANNVVVQYLVFLFEVLIHPEILAGVIVFTIVVVIVALLPTRKRRIPTAPS